GTLGCALAGRVATRGPLTARAFELGGGKSWTVILRVTPGTSLVQSPIASLPVSTGPLSAAVAIVLAMTNTPAKKMMQKIGSLDRRAFISEESFVPQISRG